MTSFKSTSALHFILFIIIGFCVGQDAHGLTEPDGRIYAIPMSEAEDVVSGWLRHMGYQIYRGNETQGGVTLFGEKKKQQWQIRLTPHSPLATKVRARFLDEGVDHYGELEKLWARLSGDTMVSQDISAASPYAPPPIIREKLDAVVCIHSQRSGKPLQISGFIIDTSGHIISTAHGLAYLEPVSVILSDGNRLTGRVVKIDKAVDLTLIEVNASLDTAIAVDRGRNMLQQGEPLFSVGCPADRGLTIYSGHISGPPRKANHHLLWQANMTILPGSSGSPIFDLKGRIVAVVKGRYRGTDSVGFLIPFESLTKFIGSN